MKTRDCSLISTQNQKNYLDTVARPAAPVYHRQNIPTYSKELPTAMPPCCRDFTGAGPRATVYPAFYIFPQNPPIASSKRVPELK